MPQRARLLLLVGADVSVLLALAPAPHELGRHLGHLATRLRSEPDAACAELFGALLWLTACWLAVGLLLTVAARGPGRLGRGFDRARRLLVPLLARRALAGALGIGVVLAPVSATAA